MIKEAYCNHEIAELLKEKGMDKECFTHYIQKNNSDRTSEAVITCTQQMAMRWLREVHNIFIEIGTCIDLNGNYHFSYTILDKDCKYIRRGYTDFDWNYEEAVEAAIQYSLKNLI